jgi:hypothetical protein
MHWFWRGAIAVGVGSFYGGLSISVLEDMHERFSDSFFMAFLNVRAAETVSWFVPVALLAVTAFGLLTRYFGPQASPDRETRCRKCGYILRGITEPRCPECGERI